MAKGHGPVSSHFDLCEESCGDRGRRLFRLLVQLSQGILSRKNPTPFRVLGGRPTSMRDFNSARWQSRHNPAAAAAAIVGSSE